jgi:hypothetical protein
MLRKAVQQEHEVTGARGQARGIGFRDVQPHAADVHEAVAHPGYVRERAVRARWGGGWNARWCDGHTASSVDGVTSEETVRHRSVPVTYVTPQDRQAICAPRRRPLPKGAHRDRGSGEPRNSWIID